MKKIILLVPLLVALVGCGYSSEAECIVKELQKMKNAGGTPGLQNAAVSSYCSKYR